MLAPLILTFCDYNVGIMTLTKITFIMFFDFPNMPSKEVTSKKVEEKMPGLGRGLVLESWLTHRRRWHAA